MSAVSNNIDAAILYFPQCFIAAVIPANFETDNLAAHVQDWPMWFPNGFESTHRCVATSTSLNRHGS